MMQKIRHPRRTARKTGIIFGCIFLIAGLILIAINFGIIDEDFRRVLISWPMLLIVLGIIHLIVNLNNSPRHGISFGIYMILIGCFFIIPRLAHAFPEVFGWASGNFTALYWPVLLIAVGLIIIFKWLFKPKQKEKDRMQYSNKHSRNHRDRINEITSDNPKAGFFREHIFSGGEYIILDPEFYGGSIKVIFGGIVLDLRKTTLPEGVFLLKVEAFFGGINIYVPEEWNIEPRIDAIAGGFNDERCNKIVVDNNRKLIIEGDCIFGGVEINN